MFIVGLKILLLASLIKYLLSEREPAMCAGIWAVGVAVFSIAFAQSIWLVLLLAPLRFGLSYLYFWLLLKCDETLLYWVVLIAGIPLMLF